MLGVNIGKLFNPSVQSGVGSQSVYALQFDGSQNYVDVGTLGNFLSSLNAGSFSIAFWVKTTQTTQASVIGVTNIGNTTSFGPAINRNSSGASQSGYIGMFIRDNNNHFANFGTTNITTVNDGNPHLVAITGTPSAFTYQVYFDGAAAATTINLTGTTNTFSNAGFNIVMGAVNSRGTIATYLSGTLDNFLVYQKVLSSQEVSDLYTGNTIPVGSIVANWQMNEGIGTTMSDSSGNSNTGTLTKGAGAYPLWVTGLR